MRGCSNYSMKSSLTEAEEETKTAARFLEASTATMRAGPTATKDRVGKSELMIHGYFQGGGGKRGIIQVTTKILLLAVLIEQIPCTQRRNSAFFLDEKMQSIFFLKMVDTNLMNKNQKKKKQVIGRNQDFCPFFRFFCFQKWRFYVYWYILFLNSYSYAIFKGTCILKTFQDKHFFAYATIV